MSTRTIGYLPQSVKGKVGDGTNWGRNGISIREWMRDEVKEVTGEWVGGNISLSSDSLGHQSVFFKEFLGQGCEKFRKESGYNSFVEHSQHIFGRDVTSHNVFFTGKRVDWTPPHQDSYHNLFLNVMGEKTWALADLNHCEKAFVGRYQTENSVRLNAIRLDDPINNPRIWRIIDKFRVVRLCAGDLLYVPPDMYHQVNTSPFTVGFSMMLAK